MNGNSINDLYIDEEERIWLANYPIGITVQNNRYSSYKWIKHSIGNRQSLINDQVNSIIEDSDGDLWFGTNNGISLLNSKTGQCIEMCGHKSHFFCPVVKCFLVRIKAGQTVFRAKQNIFVSV